MFATGRQIAQVSFILIRVLNFLMETPIIDSFRRARLRLDGEEVDLLPAQLLRKYIAYAREYVHPTLDEEAMKEVEEFYLHLRSSQYTSDSTPVTPRQLESLVRLTQVG